MAAITATIKKWGKGQTITDLKTYYVFEATVSKDDTVVIPGLTTINYCKISALDNADDIANTYTGNTITITENPCSAEKVVGIAVGIAA